MPPVAPEAVRILCKDVQLLLQDVQGAAPARRRLQLFYMMHGNEPQEYKPPMTGHPKKVLLLLMEGGEHVVCDEYYETDQGRVHIIPNAQYGQFNRADMELELQKVSMVVLEIVYEGFAWPFGLAAYEDIANHFGVPT